MRERARERGGGEEGAITGVTFQLCLMPGSFGKSSSSARMAGTPAWAGASKRDHNSLKAKIEISLCQGPHPNHPLDRPPRTLQHGPPMSGICRISTQSATADVIFCGRYGSLSALSATTIEEKKKSDCPNQIIHTQHHSASLSSKSN